ncbi:PH domain-like [Cinara cedri]|uniref:PH domain-like n=1 Tax=Cinara cedri TaxID=506608 RepID=A0A5E4MN02_9HEMI|nr:PH domain-like [Cinara cedri]
MDFDDGNNVFSQKKIDINQSKRPKSLLTHTVSTIVAKVVTASKLGNDELIPVGKYGFALAGDVIQNYYQLLLYGNKSSVLDNLIITKEFQYNVNENNTVQFLSKENWLLEFSNTKDAVDFNSHLAFVLWKLNEPKELFWMDLYYPSRNKVAIFSSIVEITYVANVVQGKNFGPEVSNNIKDSQFLKIKVSEKGWERSLLGVNDNTQRIVYIPVAEMGAWKILTDGHQCLCLTITVNNVYEIKEKKITELGQETLEITATSNSIPTQLTEIVDNNLTIEPGSSLKTVSIESLYKEFEKLKFNNVETNERLLKLEALVEEKKLDKIETLNSTELKKFIKIVFKSIIQEFPIDQKFSGSEIQTTIKNILTNAFNDFV